MDGQDWNQVTWTKKSNSKSKNTIDYSQKQVDTIKKIQKYRCYT